MAIAALETSLAYQKKSHETIQGPIHNMFCLLKMFQRLKFVIDFFFAGEMKSTSVENNLK